MSDVGNEFGPEISLYSENIGLLRGCQLIVGIEAIYLPRREVAGKCQRLAVFLGVRSLVVVQITGDFYKLNP